MILYVAIAVVVLVAVFLAIVALQPPEFRISRSASIKAPAADVFAQVNDLRAMNTWSPWLEPDPQIKLQYEGPPAGTGAAFSWNGNNQVGEGKLTITDSQPNDLIRIKLDFLRPFKSSADTEFTFKTQGDQTVVTWTMTGRKIFMSKLFGLIMSMDKMIGGNFEKGLAKMKSRVESPLVK
jgi:Polyketide cyclase / dehydrase and lipid transport